MRAMISLLLSALLITFGSTSTCCAQKPASVPQKDAVPVNPQPSQSPQQNVEVVPGQMILQEGTPVKLRLTRNVSSADATVGESVDFEVLDEIVVNGIVVIPKGGTAIGTVTEAVPKRRMGRAGKLEIVLDYVRLADTEKAPIRAVKDAKGGSHVGAMTIGIVATGLVFFPAAPLFLLMHGKDITVPKGAEVTGYVNGDLKLLTARFTPHSVEANADALNGPRPASSQNGALVVPAALEIHSIPDSGEIYVDGSFVGDTPATIKLTPGQHTIKVTFKGYRDWSREISVESGSEAHLSPSLEKQDQGIQGQSASTTEQETTPTPEAKPNQN